MVKKMPMPMTELDEAYDYNVVDCLGYEWSKKRTLDGHKKFMNIFPIGILAIPSYIFFKYVVFVRPEPTNLNLPDYTVAIDVNKNIVNN